MNKDHLHRLCYQTQSWNKWRLQCPEVRPDLSNAVLNQLASKSTLGRDRSIFRNFQEAHFQGIDLKNSDLRAVKIWDSDLRGSDLRHADLLGAEIRRSKLGKVDLRNADLRGVRFIRCDLSGARFGQAIFGGTHFGFTRLEGAEGLNEAQHAANSNIDQFTLVDSMPLPRSFLTACNVPVAAISMAELYVRDCPYCTCFISYSRHDKLFAKRLRWELTCLGVPSWFAPEDLREEMQSETLSEQEKVELERDLYAYIDTAERFLLLISRHILTSNWVGKEFQRARLFTPVVPILISDIPAPGGDAWRASIIKTNLDGKYTQLNSQSYSQELEKLLNGPILDFRSCLTDSDMGLFLGNLLPCLRRIS